MAFYNNRGAWSEHNMVLKDVEVRTGRKAWVNVIVAIFEDDGGIVRRAYGVTEQGCASRELGKDYVGLIGETFKISFGINCQVIRVLHIDSRWALLEEAYHNYSNLLEEFEEKAPSLKSIENINQRIEYLNSLSLQGYEFAKALKVRAEIVKRRLIAQSKMDR